MCSCATPVVDLRLQIFHLLRRNAGAPASRLFKSRVCTQEMADAGSSVVLQNVQNEREKK